MCGCFVHGKLLDLGTLTQGYILLRRGEVLKPRANTKWFNISRESLGMIIGRGKWGQGTGEMRLPRAPQVGA